MSKKNHKVYIYNERLGELSIKASFILAPELWPREKPSEARTGITTTTI
jgi:hypothetical protein